MADHISTDDAIHKAFVESSPDAIITKSLDGIILTWNPGAKHVYGYTAAEAIGQSMTLLLPADRPGEEIEILRTISRGERPEHFETVRRTKCGSLIDVSLAISPLRDEQGNIVGISHVARNVTERMRLDSQLRRLAAIVESSDDAILSSDMEGIVLTWNGGAERLFGYPEAEAVGRNTSLLIPEDRVHEQRELRERTHRGTHVKNFETVRRTKGGRMIDVSLTISPVRDQQGKIAGASYVERDITERNRCERELRHTQKLESLGLLAGGIAHDFNNLLTGILGNTSLALEILPGDHPIRQLLGDVLNASERASHLTRQLLAYAGKGSFVVEPTDLSRLIRETSSMIHTSIPAHVKLQLELRDDIALINGDSSQLQQLVMNLIINAAESIGPEGGGSVVVTTGMSNLNDTLMSNSESRSAPDSDTYVSLEVRDTGCGMSQDTLSQIFDPFFSTKFAGRGLGLAAIEGIVRGHNGMIDVQSHLGVGTTFRLLFPAVAGTIPKTLLPLPQTSGQGQLVLVIDDEDMVRRTAKAVLEYHGYVVVTAESGVEGIGLYSTFPEKITAVILDMTMPGMNGEETFGHLRAINPDVKIILCSGFSEPNIAGRFKGRGLAGFIQKPYTAASLADIVAGVVGRLCPL